MKNICRVLLLSSVCLMAGCGFQPMYGSHSMSASGVEARAGLSQIDIAIVPDRDGQILRNELIDRIHGKGQTTNARYTMNFTDLKIVIRELDLTKDSEATRAQIIASTVISLSDLETGETVLIRPVKSISSYNVLPSRFATRVTENNARTTALKDLARQIETQLTLYFNR